MRGGKLISESVDPIGARRLFMLVFDLGCQLAGYAGIFLYSFIADKGN
jgi:hypothetical protein